MDIRDLLDQPRELFEQLCVKRTKYAYLGKQRGIARVLAKYRMFVDTEDSSLAPHLILDGCWEPWVTLALRNLKPNMKCIDVGANHGYFTLLLADICGSVVAFEPQQHFAEIIKRNALLNGFQDRVEVHALAVSGLGDIWVLKDSENGALDKASVYCSKDDTDVVDPVFVRSMRLDSVSGPVDFIKIDAEGMEEDIWEGMQRILEEDTPTILMEFTPGLYADAEGFLEEIQARYPLQEVSDSGELVEIEPAAVLDKKYTMLWLEKEE